MSRLRHVFKNHHEHIGYSESEFDSIQVLENSNALLYRRKYVLQRPTLQMLGRIGCSFASVPFNIYRGIGLSLFYQ